MFLSFVKLFLSTAMPLRVPIFKPAALASEISGRTPIAKITRSAGSTCPFARRTELSFISDALVPKYRFTLFARISLATKEAISGSKGART